jgi:hypothetical protein
MLRIIHSIPEQCPSCGSENLSGRQMVLFGEDKLIKCDACGITMYLEDSKEPEDNSKAPASYVACPHCGTIDQIIAVEGAEWCEVCGLDPNQLNYPTSELAHLWKEGSGIKAFMSKGRLKPTSRMYRFLVNFCGPHCSFSESCEQTVANYTVCIKEEIEDSGDLIPPPPEERHSVSKSKGKKHRKERRRVRKQEEERIRKEKERAVLMCARSGWYDKRYRNEIEDSQDPKDTGGGSGT